MNIVDMHITQKKMLFYCFYIEQYIIVFSNSRTSQNHTLNFPQKSFQRNFATRCWDGVPIAHIKIAKRRVVKGENA